MITHEEWLKDQLSTRVKYLQTRSKKNKWKKNRRR